MRFPVMLFAAAALLAAGPSRVAAAESPASGSPYGWLVTVNAKAVVAPSWIGSSDYGFIAYPTVSFRRPGEPASWSSPDDSAGFAAFSRNGFSAGPVVAFREGRYDKGNAILRGVHNVGWTLEPGVFVSLWLLEETLRARIELRRGFRSEDGVVATLGLDYVTRAGDFTFAIGPRLNFADARSMRSRFGVTALDAARAPAYAPHDPGAGVASAGFRGSASWRLSSDWAFTAHGGWQRLTGGAASSPIVKIAGARDQFIAGLIASYTFRTGEWP